MPKTAQTHTPGYEVTTDGRVFSVSNWRGYGRRELTPFPNQDGYPCVRIMIGGRRVRMAVHRLVAAQFLGPKPDGCEIRHLNGNKNDNRAENLTYGTQQDNADDRERHGRTSRGETHTNAIREGWRRNGYPYLYE